MSFIKRYLGLVSFLALSACSTLDATIQLGGSLNVFSTNQSFDITDLPDDWVTRGKISKRAVSATSALGSTTVSVVSTHKPYLFARRVQASLLATPYLSWRWKILSGSQGNQPIRIVIGFSEGGASPIERSTFTQLFPGSALPRHDRVLSLLWAPSALMRGNLKPIVVSGKSKKLEAHYAVRGGAENVGFWWPETVDLASLYKLSWPTDTQSSVQVRFIGVTSATSKSSMTTLLSDLRLSR